MWNVAGAIQGWPTCTSGVGFFPSAVASPRKRRGNDKQNSSLHYRCRQALQLLLQGWKPVGKKCKMQSGCAGLACAIQEVQLVIKSLLAWRLDPDSVRYFPRALGSGSYLGCIAWDPLAKGTGHGSVFKATRQALAGRHDRGKRYGSKAGIWLSFLRHLLHLSGLMPLLI